MRLSESCSRGVIGTLFAVSLALLGSGCTFCPAVIDCAPPIMWWAEVDGLSDSDVEGATVHFCRDDECVTLPVDPGWHSADGSTWLIGSSLTAQDGVNNASVSYSGPTVDGESITIEMRASDGRVLARRHAVIDHYEVSSFGPGCGECVGASPLSGVDVQTP